MRRARRRCCARSAAAKTDSARHAANRRVTPAVRCARRAPLAGRRVLAGRSADADAAVQFDGSVGDEIAFIEDEQARRTIEFEFVDQSVDRGALARPIGIARVEHVHEQIRLAQLFQRRPNAFTRSFGRSVMNPTVSAMRA